MQLTKRDFLKTVGTVSATAGLGAVLPVRLSAAAPIQRYGKPRLNLSLAAYSFRDYFRTATHEQRRPGDAKAIDMHDFIDYCADHGLMGAELTSYYLDPQITQARLVALKRHAFLRGIAISGTAVGNVFTLPKGAKRDAQIAHVKKWIDNAVHMGAPHVRVFAGGTNGRSLKQAQSLCIEALEEVGEEEPEPLPRLAAPLSPDTGCLPLNIWSRGRYIRLSLPCASSNTSTPFPPKIWPGPALAMPGRSGTWWPT